MVKKNPQPCHLQTRTLHYWDTYHTAKITDTIRLFYPKEYYYGYHRSITNYKTYDSNADYTCEY